MIKKISAIAAAAVMAATMSIAAYATTYEDAVKAAKEAGVQSNNVQELDNFLQVHKDCFTSAQYDEMIADLNNIRDTYVAPYCKGGAKQVIDKTPAELTEADKIAVGKAEAECFCKNHSDGTFSAAWHSDQYNIIFIHCHSSASVIYHITLFIE